jgi:hypothetical protein
MGNSEFYGAFPSVSGSWIDWLNDIQVESTLAIEFALDVSKLLIVAIHSILTAFKEHASRMQENFERLHDATTSGFQVCD